MNFMRIIFSERTLQSHTCNYHDALRKTHLERRSILEKNIHIHHICRMKFFLVLNSFHLNLRAYVYLRSCCILRPILIFCDMIYMNMLWVNRDAG